MISKTMQTILHALSYGNIEVEASRRLEDIKALAGLFIFQKKDTLREFRKKLRM